jgi:hypothetical protein
MFIHFRSKAYSMSLFRLGLLYCFGMLCLVHTACADEPIELQGEYTKSGRGVQVAALAGEKFRVTTYQGGLPGQG